MPHIKFVVLTSARTGSSWLIDLLNRQPSVEAHGELFLDRGRMTPAIAGRDDYRRFIEVHGTPRLTRIPRVFAYLNALYRTKEAVGFKLMYSQLRKFPELLAYLAIRRVSIVHLTRLNLVDIVVSEELARVTGVSHVRSGVTSTVPTVHLNPTILRERLHQLSERPGQVRRLIRCTACPCIEVTYEALLNGEEEFLRTLEFLGVSDPTVHVVSSLAKRGLRSHRDAITNYDEVKQILESTPFAGMLR